MPGSLQLISRFKAFSVAVAFLFVFTACGGNEAFSVEASFSLSRGDLVISYTSNDLLSGYALLGSDKDLLFRANLPELRDSRLQIPASVWKGAGIIRFSSRSGGQHDLHIPELSNQASIRSPFEPRDTNEQPLLLTRGAIISLAVDLGDAADQANSVVLEVGESLFLEYSGSWVSSVQLPVTAGRYSVGDIRLSVGEDAQTTDSAIQAKIISESGEELVEISREIAIREISELRQSVRILETAFPSDSDDRTFGGRREGFIDLGTGGRSPNSTGGSYPVAEQSVTLESSLSVAVPVLITVQILASDGKPAEAFATPPGRPGPNVTLVSFLPADGQVSVAMPFYVDADKAVPGRYQRQISVKLAGSNLVLAQAEVPFEAGRSVDLAVLVTGVLTAVTLIVFGWLLMRRSHVLDRFTTRQIVLAGLFSATSIVVVNVPVYFLTSITVFLLGPMGFLIDGLLSEFVFFALLTVLVSIAPVQGICATVIGTRFLLSGVLLGMLTPVGALHAVSMGLALELAIYFSGVTRNQTDSAFASGVSLRLAVFFALANTLVSWISFQLAIVLFRLHYAGWYIFLSVLIGGFIYAFLGGLAGRAVGRRLAEAVP